MKCPICLDRCLDSNKCHNRIVLYELKSYKLYMYVFFEQENKQYLIPLHSVDEDIEQLKKLPKNRMLDYVEIYFENCVVNTDYVKLPWNSKVTQCFSY